MLALRNYISAICTVYTVTYELLDTTLVQG